MSRPAASVSARRAASRTASRCRRNRRPRWYGVASSDGQLPWQSDRLRGRHGERCHSGASLRKDDLHPALECVDLDPATLPVRADAAADVLQDGLPGSAHVPGFPQLLDMPLGGVEVAELDLLRHFELARCMDRHPVRQAGGSPGAGAGPCRRGAGGAAAGSSRSSSVASTATELALAPSSLAALSARSRSRPPTTTSETRSLVARICAAGRPTCPAPPRTNTFMRR